ncbi:bifunctional GNAT family N-acetyltransferase/carbon-nitrogen hydrolase family protein [Phaeocystidibacter luteus]|nr:bifunctional GNAT family N-acetyltransferase/carbon-nitrogen hydrolase family protein [Phaeocystidibacter luteus]
MSTDRQNEMHVEVRHLEPSDYDDLKSAMLASYSELDDAYWTKKHIKDLLNTFPDGQIGVYVNQQLVGAALSLIVKYSKFGDNHTYDQITGGETFSTHDSKGDTLYGIDIFVHPEYRGLRLARRLYDARKEICENLNLRAIMAGGRIPNYAEFAKELTPKEYIDKVKHQEIHDPTLSFQLSNDFHVRKVLTNYLPGDAESKDYATLLEWINIYYQPEEKLINAPKQTVRAGLVQWQMRLFPTFESLVSQIEFFVDSISGYGSDFALFPELFNAPLMEEFNHLGEHEAIREMAQYTDKLVDVFRDFAVSYNVNIICGSMPRVDEEGHLKNTSYLCHRNGNIDAYDKIHITPAEVSAWGMKGGDMIRVFDTDAGKVGILVCYDVEFPELPRLLREQEMQILFVPFLTDTQNGYMRVRSCAMARAVENECYVAIAGSVGNLPRVNNMDIQYAQSAVFTPSDFAFPNNQIKAEATPNTEMTLIVDLDLDLLKELHVHGSVRTITDRRTDLYDIKWKGQKR